ncbi:MAG: hypothetical protein QOI95_3332 [Acidimicrobiaceae bacterium]|jgi:hypothetical protein
MSGRSGVVWPAILIVAVLSTLLAACGGGGGGKAASSSSSTARLQIRDQAAQLRVKAAADFAAANDGQALALGDTVKTNGTGFAQVDYGDGSLTRIDSDAQFTVTDLTTAGQAQRVVGSLDGGRAWSNVKKITSSDGRYEVDTNVATASVRGTHFDTDCRAASGSCTFTVVDGTVAVTPTGKTEIALNAGQAVIVHRDGTVERLTDRTLDELRTDPWIAQNIDLDGGNESSGQSSKGLHTDDLAGTFKVTRTVTTGNSSVPAGQTDEYTATVSCTGSPCAPQSQVWQGLELVGNEIRSTQQIPGQPCPDGSPGSYTADSVIILRVTALADRGGRQVPTKLEGVQTVKAIDFTCQVPNEPLTLSLVADRQG